MSNRKVQLTLGITAVVVLGFIGLRSSGGGGLRNRSKPASGQAEVTDNQELARLFNEDQSDRTPEENIDWKVVGPRDKAREERAKELCRQNMLITGNDYYHIAMILQHAKAPEDYLLAHELCVIAISKGNQEAKWLAAASEDRFLMSIDRPQRFGTQYRADGANAEFKLYQMDDGITNAMRTAMDVPTPK